MIPLPVDQAPPQRRRQGRCVVQLRSSASRGAQGTRKPSSPRPSCRSTVGVLGAEPGLSFGAGGFPAAEGVRAWPSAQARQGAAAFGSAAPSALLGAGVAAARGPGQECIFLGSVRFMSKARARFTESWRNTWLVCPYRYPGSSHRLQGGCCEEEGCEGHGQELGVRRSAQVGFGILNASKHPTAISWQPFGGLAVEIDPESLGLLRRPSLLALKLPNPAPQNRNC